MRSLDVPPYNVPPFSKLALAILAFISSCSWLCWKNCQILLVDIVSPCPSITVTITHNYLCLKTKSSIMYRKYSLKTTKKGQKNFQNHQWWLRTTKNPPEVTSENHQNHIKSGKATQNHSKPQGGTTPPYQGLFPPSQKFWVPSHEHFCPTPAKNFLCASRAIPIFYLFILKNRNLFKGSNVQYITLLCW